MGFWIPNEVEWNSGANRLAAAAELVGTVGRTGFLIVSDDEEEAGDLEEEDCDNDDVEEMAVGGQGGVSVVAEGEGETEGRELLSPLASDLPKSFWTAHAKRGQQFAKEEKGALSNTSKGRGGCT